VSLRDKLLALADDSLIGTSEWRADYERRIVIAAARLALEEAARECHVRRNYGLAARIRALAEGLE